MTSSYYPHVLAKSWAMGMLFFFSVCGIAQEQSGFEIESSSTSEAASSSSQRRLKTADQYFNDYDYIKAANIYTYLYDNKGADSLCRKIAICYTKTAKLDTAVMWYERTANSSFAQPEDLYQFAELLKQVGDYKTSDKWLRKYQELVPEDSRPKRKLEDPSYYENLSTPREDVEVILLEANSKAADFGPAYYGKDVIFVSSREDLRPVKRRYNWTNLPFYDMYIGIRDPGGYQLRDLAVFEKGQNTKYHDGPATFSSDGNEMYFTRNQKSPGSQGTFFLTLHQAQKVKGEWKYKGKLPFNSNSHSVGHAALDKEGKRLYFTSDMPGGKGGTDIYYSTRYGSDSWSMPKNLGDVVNTEGNEMFPFIHEDGSLYFSSDGHAGLGGLDLYLTRETNDIYSAPINLGAPINTSRDDFALILDSTNLNGYFSSNRYDGKGNDDLYAFRLTRAFQRDYLIIGKVIDDQDSILPKSLVTLTDDENDQIAQVKADDKGMFEFVINPEQRYMLTGRQDGYIDGQKRCYIKDPREQYVAYCDIVLETKPDLSLYGIVTDAQTGEPLEGVDVKITDNFSNEELLNLFTPVQGDFRKGLADKKKGERLSYNVSLKKEGYLAKTVPFYHTVTKEEEIYLHMKLDLTMDKIDVGTDIGKLIDINPIYFDLNKYNIRPDAAQELDKIVAVMMENPTISIELGSHTDCRGSRSYYEKLSDRRAKSSAKYVQERIDRAERIFGRGYGEAILVNDCACEGRQKSSCNEEQHQQNRRTEFKIVEISK